MTTTVAAKTSRTIAEELKTLHADCRGVMAAMQALISSPVYDPVKVPSARHRMSQASTRRLKFLCDVAYPAALKQATPAQVEVIRALQGQATINRARTTAHVTKWSSAEVSADWAAFQRDSAGIIAMMADRLDQESRTLLPMLQRLRP